VNLWFVHQNAVPPSRSGLMRSYHLARLLTERGHRVTVIASSFDHRAHVETLAPGEMMRRTVEDGVEFFWLRTPVYTGNTLRRAWNMIAFAHRVTTLVPRAGLGVPDLVVGSSPPPFAAFAAARLAKRYGAPFVLEVRDLWPQTLIDLRRFELWHPFVHLLLAVERQIYRRAARIVTVLPNAGAHMVEKGAAAARIDWIPNGIDLSCVPPPSPPAASGPFTVVYAGAHGFANGLGTVLDAAARLQQEPATRHVRLRLIGNGVEKPALQQRAAREGLANVTFDDAVPNARLYEVLAEADAFVANVRTSPLYRYGVSINKLFDYMAMARPTAIAISAFNNPIAEAGAGISVAADDAAGLARAIAELAALPPEERFAMGLRGRRYIETHHDYAQLAARFEASLEMARAQDPTATSAMRIKAALP
jgi:glycosyltransferase involved in cell wall biosynthesis